MAEKQQNYGHPQGRTQCRTNGVKTTVSSIPTIACLITRHSGYVPLSVILTTVFTAIYVRERVANTRLDFGFLWSNITNQQTSHLKQMQLIVFH